VSQQGRFQSKRARTILGLVVVAVSLVVAASLAGIGFAWSGISSSQYEYGKVTMCHHTHSKKHPNVTITVSKNAEPAHLKHGDTEGACKPPAPGNPGDHGKGKGKGNGKGDDENHTTTTSAPTTTTTTSGGNDGGDHGNNGNNGNNGNGHGNSGDHGNGKGHGK
jgi:hypothetical protein